MQQSVFGVPDNELKPAIAIPVGIYTAARRGRPADTTAMGATQLGIAIPNFWFALLLVYVFAVTLQWVPAGGFPGWRAGVWPAFFCSSRSSVRRSSEQKQR